MRSGAQCSRKTRRLVAIVDDHTFFAACLRALLDGESDLAVCGVASAPHELGDRLPRLEPDLLVIDLTLGTESGLDLARRLRLEHHVTVPILFLSSLVRPSPEQLAGAVPCDFVAKTGRPAELLAVIRQMLAPVEADAEYQLALHLSEVRSGA